MSVICVRTWETPVAEERSGVEEWNLRAKPTVVKDNFAETTSFGGSMSLFSIGGRESEFVKLVKVEIDFAREPDWASESLLCLADFKAAKVVFVSLLDAIFCLLFFFIIIFWSIGERSTAVCLRVLLVFWEWLTERKQFAKAWRGGKRTEVECCRVFWWFPVALFPKVTPFSFSKD